MAERDQEDQDLRIELMNTQIERIRQEIRMENRKFFAQALSALAAAMAAGAAIFGLILHLTGRL